MYLSEQQSKTQEYSVNNDTQQREVENLGWVSACNMTKMMIATD